MRPTEPPIAYVSRSPDCQGYRPPMTAHIIVEGSSTIQVQIRMARAFFSI
jgi:hypothetical protein